MVAKMIVSLVVAVALALLICGVGSVAITTSVARDLDSRSTLR
jgi:hypothetical protein